ncbi:B3/B4 domain-containing protein [Brevibacillus massiliensis]|uniref:B3/B4 domain-containing protein n=1 Tax=Brevibacillus massiliensis TaxID=1118054 RepID=UPI0002F7BC6B|nr:phenylalanine--tRNA ligase beta subunit-related protein [Brevibacillus massiliensis]
MKVTISPDVFDKLPDFSLGVIHYSDIALSESPKMLRGRINLFVESLRIEHEPAKLTEIEGIREWRAAFKRLGIDPSRYRPSSEALLRRLIQGNPFHLVNSAVDVNNFLSIHYALPYGIYDLSKLSGQVVCRLGTETDAYEALNGREVQMKGKLLLADEEGAFGSPIVDSVRTSVKDGASQLLQVIFFHPMLSVKQQDEIIGSTARMLTEINGGEVVFADAVRAIS